MSQYRNRISCLLVVAGLMLATPSTPPTLASDATQQGNLADIGGGNQSVDDGAQKFLVRRKGNHRYIDVYYNNRRLFTVEDRKDDSSGDANVPNYSQTKDRSGDTLVDDYDHDFSLAPDHKHLFIEQKTMHCYDIATLYGPQADGSYGMVRVHGLPFDEAAGRAFCRIMNIRYEYDGGTRVTHFVGWTKDGLDFTVGAGNFYCGDGPYEAGNIEHDWSGHFDFKTQRFTKVHLDSIYTHAEWQKERDSVDNTSK